MSTISPKRVTSKRHRPAVHTEAVTSVGLPKANSAPPVWEPWLPERLRWNNVDWIVVAWMVAMHAGALAAPFYFSWQAVAVTFVLHWFTASIGICLGYHRFLSHKSFKLK